MSNLISRRSVLGAAAGLVVAAGSASAELAPAVDVVVTPARVARVGGWRFQCAVGRGGIRLAKREGDGATPAGAWTLREVFYRADRMAAPVTKLPLRALKPDDGWCDAPNDPQYNRPVRLPYPASAETLWRGDHVYDIIVVAGYNDAPVVPGAGSAIFLHIARSRYQPTAGCVAFAPGDLLKILSVVDPRSRLDVRV